jgi:sec-independent protein translocase protein TatA
MGLGGFGMGEMIFIFLIVLLLFGAKRLPEIGSSLGKGIREFKSSVREIEHELKVPERQIHHSAAPPGESTSADGEEAEDDDDGEPRRLSGEGATQQG